MRHALIVPHRKREAYLRVCLHSLRRNRVEVHPHAIVFLCNAGALREEILSVDELPIPVITVQDDSHPDVFNKPRLLNIGIERALRLGAEVLTFLDCDAIVGERFLEGATLCDWSRIHRLCYRVRYLPEFTSQGIIEGKVDPFACFDRWSTYPLAFEAYHAPELHRREGGEPWGNSQFSIHRDTLGDLRFDEAYSGRGFEDLDFLKRLSLRLGDTYRGQILTDPQHAMFHLRHPYSPDWYSQDLLRKNTERYKALTCPTPSPS